MMRQPDSEFDDQRGAMGVPQRQNAPQAPAPNPAEGRTGMGRSQGPAGLWGQGGGVGPRPGGFAQPQPWQGQMQPQLQQPMRPHPMNPWQQNSMRGMPGGFVNPTTGQLQQQPGTSFQNAINQLQQAQPHQQQGPPPAGWSSWAQYNDIAPRLGGTLQQGRGTGIMPGPPQGGGYAAPEGGGGDMRPMGQGGYDAPVNYQKPQVEGFVDRPMPRQESLFRGEGNPGEFGNRMHPGMQAYLNSYMV